MLWTKFYVYNTFHVICILVPKILLIIFFIFKFINVPHYSWLGFSTRFELSLTHVRDWLIGRIQIYGPNCILKRILMLFSFCPIISSNRMDQNPSSHRIEKSRFPRSSHPNIIPVKPQSNPTQTPIISSQSPSQHHYFIPFLPLYKLKKSIIIFQPTTIITYPFI
jgi:hypothetical protein